MHWNSMFHYSLLRDDKIPLKQVLRDNSWSGGKASLHPWFHLKEKSHFTSAAQLSIYYYSMWLHYKRTNLKTQLAGFLGYKASTKHNARIWGVCAASYCCYNNTTMLDFRWLPMEVKFDNLILLILWHCKTLEFWMYIWLVTSDEALLCIICGRKPSSYLESNFVVQASMPIWFHILQRDTVMRPTSYETQ